MSCLKTLCGFLSVHDSRLEWRRKNVSLKQLKTLRMLSPTFFLLSLRWWHEVNRILLFAAIGNQYGQFLARSTHKSPLRCIMQFVCNWISHDMLRSGWCVEGDFKLLFGLWNRIFSEWSTKIALSFASEKKENSCCVSFTVVACVLHFFVKRRRITVYMQLANLKQKLTTLIEVN